MDGVKPDGAAAGKADAGFDGGDLFLYEEAELGIDEGEAAVKDHAVGVPEGALDDVRVGGFEVLHLVRPPAVGFGEEDEVGLKVGEEAAVDIGAAVLHEDIGGDDAE